VIFGKPCWAEGEARPPVCLWFRNIYPRGGGKVENLFLVFHFPIRLVAGAVGMWESRLLLARFPRGSWKEGKPAFGFPAFHSPGISTALWLHGVFRQRANRFHLAFCIRRAASVSLIASACRFSISAVIPGFKDSAHFSSDVSFS
jgi:hypothetical protein